jgi:cell division protein FtsB
MRFSDRNYYYRKPRKKRKSPRLKIWFYRIIEIGFVLWFLYLFVGGRYGLVKIISLYTRLKRVERKIDIITAEEIVLEKKCKKLEGDLFTIEKIAREKLGMIKQGEIVYKIIREE